MMFVVFIVKVKKIKGTTLVDSTALDALLFVREWNPGKSAQFMCASDRGNGKVHNKGSPQKTPAPNKLSIKERLAAREPTPFYQKAVDVDLIAEEDEEEENKSSSSSASDGKVIKVEEPGSEDNDFSNTEDGSVSAAAVASSDTVVEGRSPEVVVQPPVHKRQKRG